MSSKLNYLIMMVYCLGQMYQIHCLVEIPKIAVIGGGIGGTSVTYFLQDLFGQDGAKLDLYESNKIGGRLSTASIQNNEYEIGGSVIHPRNKYMADFTTLLGLKKRTPETSKFGLYNGKNFVFSESSNWNFINQLSLLWKYGYSVIKLQNYIDNMLQDFDRIYDKQENGHAYATVPDLLNAMSPEFVADLAVSAKDGFKQSGFSDEIINDLVTATLITNYGQTASVHKFVGAVSVAGANGGLWSVSGGNRLVPKGLLEISKANLIKAKVLNITLDQQTDQFILHSSDSSGRNSLVYDIVVLATPLTKDTRSDLEFVNFPEKFSFPGKYHRTICTIIDGTLNHTYFGFDSPEDIIQEIFTVRDDLFFSSVGRIYPVTYEEETTMVTKHTIWKIFSHIPLKEQELDALFLSRKSVQVTDWLAYPDYHTKSRTDSFVLYKNLYHINAIEWAASAMEMSAIGAKNAALLAYNNWRGESNFIEENTDRVSNEASHSDL